MDCTANCFKKHSQPAICSTRETKCRVAPVASSDHCWRAKKNPSSDHCFCLLEPKMGQCQQWPPNSGHRLDSCHGPSPKHGHLLASLRVNFVKGPNPGVCVGWYRNANGPDLRGSHPELNLGHGPELVRLPARRSDRVRQFDSKTYRLCPQKKSRGFYTESNSGSVQTSQSHTDSNSRAQKKARKRQVLFRFLL